MDHKRIAKEVLERVGSEGNINTVVHCATRLRFNLKDKSKVDKAAVESVEGVISVVEAGGQFQVIIGNEVSDVYKAISETTNLGAGGSSDNNKQDNGESKNVFNKLIDIISSIFTPFLGAMAGAGILKGLLSMFIALNWISADSGTYQILLAASDSIFNFLPLFLAFTAAKKFNANQFVSVSIAGALLHPNIAGALAGGLELKFLGIPVILQSYASSVIPIILAVFIQGYVERWFNKFMPKSIKNIVTPMLTLVIMVPLTFLAFGPFGTYLGEGLASIYTSLYNLSPFVAGAIIGAFWQVFVIFGVHWAFVPLMTLNFERFGFDTLISGVMAAVLAQAGASFAVFLRTKSKKMKTLSGSTTISAIFGITEPAVYGVTLRLKRPFIFACIGGAVGGAIACGFGSKSFAFGLASLLSLPAFVGEGSNFAAILIGVIVAVVVSFLLTFILGFKDIPEEAGTAAEENDTAAKGPTVVEKQNESVGSPLKGKCIPLSEIEDKAFSSGAIGQGVGVIPSEGRLVSPVNGVVTAMFPTKHAIGVTSDNGLEVLMHIGMDTVQLDGKYFTTYVKQGDIIKKGQQLIDFDIENIQKEGYKIVTPVVVTNYADYNKVEPVKGKAVVPGETIISVFKK